jgi:hypothetical protein
MSAKAYLGGDRVMTRILIGLNYAAGSMGCPVDHYLTKAVVARRVRFVRDGRPTLRAKRARIRLLARLWS